MKNIPILFLIFSIFFINGCAGRFRYGGEAYSDPKEALAAQTKAFDEALKEIPVRENGIVAKIIVISPSKSTTEALGINKIGGTSLPKDSSDYLGQIMENDYQLNGRALKKSKAFTEVDLKIADYPLKEARVLVENHSAVIYLNMLSPTQVGWYMLKSNNEAPVQINYNAIAKGSKRIDSWIDSATAAYRNKNEE